MKLDEAYKKLDLKRDASVDDAKKKFRELAKKYHPDNKETGSEAKFKEINEAYSCVQSGKGTDPEPNIGFDMGNMWNPMNIQDMFSNMGFGRRPYVKRVLEHIKISIPISFKESVFGCKKDIVYNRKIKCNPCNGAGSVEDGDKCTLCYGLGFIHRQQGNIAFRSTCPKCMGIKQNTKPCSSCNEEGSIHSDTSINLTIPAGILNGQTLRLAGMGNFVHSDVQGDGCTDVFAEIQVLNNTNFSLEGKDVISQEKISLLEALQGVRKSVMTLDGEIDVDIPKMSRNRDEIIISNLGVGRKGNQRVKLDVIYPEDCTKLIEVLNAE